MQCASNQWPDHGSACARTASSLCNNCGKYFCTQHMGKERPQWKFCLLCEQTTIANNIRYYGKADPNDKNFSSKRNLSKMIFGFIVSIFAAGICTIPLILLGQVPLGILIWILLAAVLYNANKNL